MSNLKIRQAKNKKELAKVLGIREIVFINEQKVPKKLEIDGLDNAASHIIAFYENKPAGCARIRFIGKKAKLERIAVLKKYRNKGFGKMIMNYLIKFCRNKKVKEICMNAQYYLKDYYSKFGFRPKGKTFMEAGIKHVYMTIKNN